MSTTVTKGAARTVGELCKAIWSVEREFKLLELEVEGVKVWQYTRMEIYYYLAEQSGVFIEAHPIKRSAKDILRQIPQLLKAIFVESPFWLAFKKVDEFVIEHPRSMLVEGERVDIYTQKYRETARSSGKKIVSLERLDLGAVEKSPDRNRYSLACLPLLLTAWRRVRKYQMSVESLACINRASSQLSAALGCEVSLTPILTRSISKFKLYAFLYRLLFKATKPEKLTVVIGYACGDAIYAAKQLGIETAEVQHGTFSAYHLGYSYPGRTAEVQLFPKRMLIWGRHWAQIAPLPIPAQSISVIGFDFYQKKLSALPAVEKNAAELVIISQGALGDKIAACVNEYCRGLQGYTIYYKLHPSEYNRWREYPFLEELSRAGIIEIVTDQYDLYALLNQAAIQVGVFSTALYEGLALGCKTILLDLPGVEYMAGLIDANMASLASSKEDFAVALHGAVGHADCAAAIFGFENIVCPDF